MIDQNARARLLERARHNELISSIQELKDSQPQIPINEIVQPMEKVNKTNSNNFIISTIAMGILRKISHFCNQILSNMPTREDMQSLGDQIKDIKFPATPTKITVDSPELLVAIKNIKIPEMPEDISINNLDENKTYLERLTANIEKIKPQQLTKVEVVNQSQLDTTKIEAAITNLSKQLMLLKPRDVKMPPVDFGETNLLLQELRDRLDTLSEGMNRPVEFPTSLSVNNFPPQKVPQPVTNVSLNPNRGTVTATAVTVTTALTPLPGTALADRRSMMIHNNSSTTIIYVGGSNVTAATGIPVSPGTYGPSLDAGPRNIVYAVTSAGSADVRVLEMNDLTEGGDS